MEGFFWAAVLLALAPNLPALHWRMPALHRRCKLSAGRLLSYPYALRTARPVAQALAVAARRCFPVTRVFPGAKAVRSFYYYLPADK